MGLIGEQRSFRFRKTLRELACCQLALVSGCGGEAASDDLQDTATGGDFAGDDFDIAELAENLDPTGITCAVSGMVVTLAVADDAVAMFSKSPSSTTLLVNGGMVTCSGGTPLSTMTVLLDRGAKSTSATVILDYQGGMFAPGTAALAGIDTTDLMVDDVLKIRGSDLVDTYVFGASGVGIDAGNLADITLPAVAVTVQVALGEGADTFSTAGSGAATGATNTIGLQYAGAPLIAVTGGNGNDTFKAAPLADGAQDLTGGGGVDVADYGLRTVGNSISVTSPSLADDGAVGENDNVRDDIETIKGGKEADILFCATSAFPKILFGGPGDDSLTGSAYADTLNGDAGNDLLDGDLGIDLENGGDGDDTFDQGSAANGADLLNGGAGADLVDYSARVAAIAVDLSAAAGDGLTGENDSVGADVEDVTGASGAYVNTLTGSAGANVLTGGAGGDVIKGGAGDDTIIGGGGVDNLKGEDGDDTLECGGQADVVDCGLGDDILFDALASGTPLNCEL